MCEVCEPETFDTTILPEDDEYTIGDKLTIDDFRDELDSIQDGICPFCGKAIDGFVFYDY